MLYCVSQSDYINDLALYLTVFCEEDIMDSSIQHSNSSRFTRSGLSSGKIELNVIIQALWPSLMSDEESLHPEYYGPFLEYITGELLVLRHYESDFAVHSWESMERLLEDMNAHREMARSQYLESWRTAFRGCDDLSILRSLELAVRLSLTLNIRTRAISVNPVSPKTTAIDWTHGRLDHLIQGRFAICSKIHNMNDCRINPAFTAANLVKVAGIKIHWVDNLADHLLYDDEKRAVRIYQHKICLLNHLKSANGSFLSQELLGEAIDTLNLLFPFGKSSTRSFLEGQKKPFYGLGFCGRDRVLDLRKYSYWADRLSELIEAFNEPPHDWWRLLNDRRNKLQFTTFWIAFVVLVLTVISLAFAIFSSIYTYKQYELARLQMCAADGRPPEMQGFCA